MNETSDNKTVIYEFGKFVLDPQERTLLAKGKSVHLSDKVFDTLLCLVENNGQLLTKDKMMTSIWEESFVEESNLAKNISRLRKILNADGVELIETLPKRGYRFLADVREIDGTKSLLVQRNLPVKITVEEDTETLSETRRQSLNLDNKSPRSRISLSLRLAIAIAALSAIIISIIGFYFWKHEKPVTKNESGIIRLTDEPQHETNAQWTQDNQIRFANFVGKRRAESFLMNPDGSGRRRANEGIGNLLVGNWSPDGRKVMFFRDGGDGKTVYLANADGSDEIKLPFSAGNMDWSPDSRKFVYQSGNFGDNSELFVYSLENGKSENVTNNPAFDADPSFSPDGARIVFVSSREGANEIYLMNADGGNLNRLTNHPSSKDHPSFSPDGTQIAFNSDRENENSDVYLMNMDGDNLRRLTDWKTNESVIHGCWSPDGTQIVFMSDRDGNDDIFIKNAEVYQPELVVADEMSNLQSPSVSPDDKQIVFQAETENKSSELRLFNVETGQSRVLLKTENADLSPVFSPDGKQIVFQKKQESNTEICSIKADGSGFVNLTQNGARDASPSFSPDGRQIAFVSNRDGNYGNYNIFAMNADGSNQRQIYATNQGASVSPVFTPDGASLIFANDKEEGRTGNFELFSVGFETGEAEKRLTFRHRYDWQPAISPNGAKIVFSSTTDGNLEIYLMNADGTGLLRLTRNAAEDFTPQFSKDGKRIIFSSNRNGKFAIYEIELTE